MTHNCETCEYCFVLSWVFVGLGFEFSSSLTKLPIGPIPKVKRLIGYSIIASKYFMAGNG